MTLESLFMNHAVSLAHSAQCLKKAIPLMVKYRMPVTPINYAICTVTFKGVTLH